jgi:hypothetical protein
MLLMHLKLKTSFVLLLMSCGSFAHGAITLSGPIVASSVTVTGNVTVSSMTVSDLTITSQLNVVGTINDSLSRGRVVQVKMSTAGAMGTTSTSFIAVPELSQTIALSSATSYVRISLTGTIESVAYVTIFRDASVNLGDATLGFSTLNQAGPFGIIGHSGIVITDSPNDTSLHTYQAYIRKDASYPSNVTFPYESVGCLILEEISR